MPLLKKRLGAVALAACVTGGLLFAEGTTDPLSSAAAVFADGGNHIRVAADPGPIPGHLSTTHVIARVRPGIEPSEATAGRWTFAVVPEDSHLHFPHEAERQQIAHASHRLADLLDERNVERIGPAVQVEPRNRELAQQVGLDRYYRVEVPPGSDTPSLADELRGWTELFESIEVDGVGGVAQSPNDPDFPLQFGLHNTGQLILGVPGVPGADINALAAWQLTTGSDDVVIAVIDSGVQEHVDLNGRLLPGWNVVTNPPSDNSAPANDCNSHGTHVAGIIAANVNNSTGVAGVTWQSKILPIVVLNGCSGTQSDLANGVLWAADNGADIINMSLQYGPPGSSFLHSAVQYAYSQGILLVGAAGNDNSFGVCNGTTCIAYPARWPEVIAVGATTNQDQKWGASCSEGSNCGPELSVVAAGFRVRSTVDTSITAFKTGTSFATPHVSGTAALMLAQDPDLSPAEIQAILEATAHDLGTPGFNTQFGHGRIDAHAALLEVIGPVPGDLNGDGVVNVHDLLILLGSWGPCSDCTPVDCPADLDGNCEVNIFDLLLLLGNWG